MVTRGISRGARKLPRTPSLSKKKKKDSFCFGLRLVSASFPFLTLKLLVLDKLLLSFGIGFMGC